MVAVLAIRGDLPEAHLLVPGATSQEARVLSGAEAAIQPFECERSAALHAKGRPVGDSRDGAETVVGHVLHHQVIALLVVVVV